MVFDIHYDGAKYTLVCDGEPIIAFNSLSTAKSVKVACELDAEVLGRKCLDLTVWDCQKVFDELRELIRELKGGM